MEFTNNTVLITGGASGIGYAMVEYMLEKGNEVIICGRNLAKLEEAKAKHPEIHIIQCDVANKEDREKMLEIIKKDYPQTNFLINNAGIQKSINLKKGVEELEKGIAEIDINLYGTMYLSTMFIPVLEGKENAAILNVCSGLAFVPDRYPQTPVYSASKAGVHAFTKSLRQQVEDLGITVLEIIPPMVATDLNPEETARLKALDPEKYDNPDIIPTPEIYVKRTFAKLEEGAVEVKY